jgi:taurine dioxygenase
MPTRSDVRVKKLSGTVGARIDGLDVTHLDDDTFAEVQALFAEHLVLVFSDQRITPAQQVEFARRWGPISVHPGLTPIDGHPEVVEVYDPKNPIAATWHQDQTFLEEPPALSMLAARVLPESGGDTMFANQYEAFERLSPAFQEVLAGLRAVHRRTVTDPHGTVRSFDAEAVHPVAPRHPVTGRRALMVNADYTVQFEGMTPEESRPWLEHLYREATRPEISVRHSWREHDLVMWDNRALLHCVVSDASGPRLLHKVTIAGERPAD